MNVQNVQFSQTVLSFCITVTGENKKNKGTLLSLLALVVDCK